MRLEARRKENSIQWGTSEAASTARRDLATEDKVRLLVWSGQTWRGLHVAKLSVSVSVSVSVACQFGQKRRCRTLKYLKFGQYTN